MHPLVAQAENGFKTLTVNDSYIQKALNFLDTWLTDATFAAYVPQIEHLIQTEKWDYLLDSFYQVIPFGTGGRRGEVGVGPNRINPWTIQASAQGHSQYLLKKYGEAANERGVVFAFDVRQFSGNDHFTDYPNNPLKDLTSGDLARSAARVYAANGIKVYIFDDVRTTPELSFAIRHLNGVAGAMFSASHNPPTHNGKKVYDEFGGQLVPPHDEELVEEVTQNVSKIKTLTESQAKEEGLIIAIGTEVDQAYVEAAAQVSLSEARDLKIVFTPLHGCGSTSVTKAFDHLGFTYSVDPATSNPSGKFEHVTFNIPNPEVIQSFDTPLKFAKEQKADIILSTDPDADRIGSMVKHKEEWVFLNGNEIAAILAEFVINKRLPELDNGGVIVKTTVTTNLIKKIAEDNGVEVVGELLIGFKYIGEIMNQLEDKGEIDRFLFGCEESHGYLAGNYARDKDAVTAAVWLAELAAELKQEGKTLVDYLNELYSKYGFYRNYLTEIRLLGAVGKERITKIQDSLRNNPPTSLGRFKVKAFEDCINRKPLVSDTDRSAKDVLIFQLEPEAGIESMRVTIRPSGTEPKSKMYFEIGTQPITPEALAETKTKVEMLLKELEKAVMLSCYSLIDVDFPERGFLLFWQLPLDDKLKYFEIEPEIAELKTETDASVRRQQLSQLLSFLGSNPIQKVDDAFTAKYGQSIEAYLKLEA